MKLITNLIITIILISIVAACFVGCDSADAQTVTSSSTVSSVTSEANKDEWGMEYLGQMSPDGGSTHSVNYYRDIKTDVMYIYFNGRAGGSGGAGGPTVMYDPDTGLPLTYSRYKELYK